MSGLFKRKPKFYTIDKIKQKGAVYNIIIGERSNGKTYSTLRESVVRYFENGGQVAIVRRWKEDIIGRRASGVFSALVANDEIRKISKGEYEGVHYTSGKFYVCNYDEDRKPIYNEDDCIGHAFALSDSEHNKSISYPKVEMIIFDEFLTKHTYLTDEFVLFMNTVSTIVRQRTNVVIYMLGNTVNRYSPYFAEMGLTHVPNMEQGTIDIYRYGDGKLTVAVEYCASTGNSKENNFYFAFDNPKLEMIKSGAWELDLFPHLPVKYKPKDVLYRYFIEFADETFQCEVVQTEGFVFTYIHVKTTPIKYEHTDLVYTFEHTPHLNHNRNIFKPMNKYQEKILWFFRNDKVFYQDNEVGNTIRNYLKECGG